MRCRHCGSTDCRDVIDLGAPPPSNAYRTPEEAAHPEPTYPLRVKVCQRCWLVQTEDFVRPEDVFTNNYPYFSSTSRSWSEHARAYVERMIEQCALGADSLVVEVACNDGYLLRHVVQAGIRCLGVEPTGATGVAARAQGVPVVQEFFDEPVARRLAEEYGRADLLIANHVLAHVPDINGFARGLAALLSPSGTLTLEFAHLLPLIEHGEFDTIYHEHFSYLSLRIVDRILRSAGLRIWDAELLELHGGSLRVFACHAEDPRSTRSGVGQIMRDELDFGLEDTTTYQSFQEVACRRRDALVAFLQEQREMGRTVLGYGAAAKGNTLLNFAGITPALLPAVADAAAAKQGLLLPGSGIPIISPEELVASQPDCVLILPWNLADEIRAQLEPLVGSAEFVVAGPELAAMTHSTEAGESCESW